MTESLILPICRSLFSWSSVLVYLEINAAEDNTVLKGVRNAAVDLEAHNHHDNLLLVVKDKGIGISDDDKLHMFTSFFRGKNAANIQGTGLGLSLSYDIITKGHGGELKVKTEEGEYTEFVVQLPL